MKTTMTREWTDRVSRHAARVLMGAVAVLALVPAPAAAFNSESTGANGVLNPTVNTIVELPPDGILNYVSVNIPAGVTVTFRKNQANTPAVLLVQGDVTIAGTLDVSGEPGTASGAAGSGNLGDDGQPGAGGPGGFDGGRGGAVTAAGRQHGATGLGPGGGDFGRGNIPNVCDGGASGVGGGGGGYGTVGNNATCTAVGPVYGSSLMLPLIGGSGGGGGGAGSNFGGAGGGGGAGAILIAATGRVDVTASGLIRADGGTGGATGGAGCGGGGGAGSGGGIRIVATTIAGNGAIQAAGGSGGGSCVYGGGSGGAGRIRLEAETMQRTANTNPFYTTNLAGTSPGPAFVAGSPSLRISRVAGVDAPATPTGSADIVLPAATPNPVTVVFTTQGVPVGNTVTLTVTPASGAVISAVSPALSSTGPDAATASVNVNLPSGPSVLSARTTYTVTASVGDALSRFAQGERVEKVTLVAKPGAASTAILHTASGKTYEVATALLPSGG